MLGWFDVSDIGVVAADESLAIGLAVQPHAKHHLKSDFLARPNKTCFRRNTIPLPIAYTPNS